MCLAECNIADIILSYLHFPARLRLVCKHWDNVWKQCIRDIFIRRDPMSAKDLLIVDASHQLVSMMHTLTNIRSIHVSIDCMFMSAVLQTWITHVPLSMIRPICHWTIHSTLPFDQSCFYFVEQLVQRQDLMILTSPENNDVHHPYVETTEQLRDCSFDCETLTCRMDDANTGPRSPQTQQLLNQQQQQRDAWLPCIIIVDCPMDRFMPMCYCNRRCKRQRIRDAYFYRCEKTYKPCSFRKLESCWDELPCFADQWRSLQLRHPHVELRWHQLSPPCDHIY